MGVKSHWLSGGQAIDQVPACDSPHQEVGVWISSGHEKTVKKIEGDARAGSRICPGKVRTRLFIRYE